MHGPWGNDATDVTISVPVPAGITSCEVSWRSWGIDSRDGEVDSVQINGEEVWAMGLHAGARKRFKAEVLSLRKQFPRIIVKYTATEDGNTAAIALPEMRTAYVTMADVEPKDW